MKQPVIRVQDQLGRHAFWATVERCNQLVAEGAARPFGSKKKVHGIRLLASLEALGLKPERPDAAAARLQNTNFTTRRRVAGGLVYQHKRPRCGAEPFTRVIAESMAA